MEPISTADRIVLLLRQKLEARAKASRGSRPGEAAKTTAPTEPMGVRAMAAIAGADDAPLRRAVVQDLLADQFGRALINDAQFQQIVSRVTETIEDDRETAELLSRVIAELRAG